jgi:hypothetical protein
MASATPLHLKVITDTTDAVELAPRVKAAAHTALAAADRVDRVLFNEDNLAGAVAAEVMAEILRVRQATPAESAQARAIERVRQLHRDWEADPGHCAHCQVADGNLVPYPCPTIRALDGQEQTS